MFGTGIDNSGFESGVNSLKMAADVAIGNIVANMVSQVSSAAAQIPAQMVAVGSGFEASMSQVAATMGITSAAAEFEILSEAAKDMGESTKFSASQAGEALNYLALAGYDAEKAVAALPTVLNVAAAGGMELASASDMITDAMSALGLETSQMATFADQLAVTAQKSNTSVSQLGEAILTVGGTAKTLSGGVVEMNTALGILADNGIKGSEGGTALRNVILSLSAPTDTAAESLERLGVKAFDASGTMRPLQDTFADLNTALSTLSDGEKSAVLSDIFNRVDLKSVNALLGTSAERFDELSGYIADCEGAAAQMAETMDDNLKGDLTILQSAIEGLGIAAYEKFQQPFRESVQEVTSYVGELTESLSDGELSDSVDKISDGFSDLTKSALEFASETVIPVIISGLEKIVDHSGEIKTILALVAAEFIAMKAAAVLTPVVNSITAANRALNLLAAETSAATFQQVALASGMSFAEIAVGLFTGKLTAATAAEAAFNAVCAVNPVMLIATALAAVVAGLGIFISKVKETTAELNKHAESIKNINALTEETIDNAEIEIGVVKRKMQEYEDLRKQYLETGEGEELLRKRAEELQEYMPEGTRLIDEQTGAYESLAGSIDTVTDAMRKRAYFQAYDEEYAAKIKEQVQIQKELEEMEANFEKTGWYGGKSPNAPANHRAIDRAMYGTKKAQSEELENDIKYIEEKVNELSKASSEADNKLREALNSNAEYGQLPIVDFISNSMSSAIDAYNNGIEEFTEYQDASTEKLKSEWVKLEHEYAIGVISSESELYAKKQAAFDKYGDEDLEVHWDYYEDLIDYQKSFAEKAQQEYEQQLQDEWNSISHMQSLGLISAEDAYRQQLAFISKYCGEYSDEWYSYYKTIMDYQREAQQEQVESVRDNISEIVREYKSAFSDLESDVNSYKNRLMSVGSLFSMVTETDKEGKEKTTYSVENLRKQMDEMKKYHGYITDLKNRNTSQAVLSELTAMDFEDSSFVASNLAAMSDAELAEINDLYTKKQKLAEDLANELYAPEMDKLNSDLVKGVIAEFGTLPPDIQAIGAEALTAFIAGLNSGNLSEQVDEFTTRFVDECMAGIENSFAGSDLSDSFAALMNADTYSMGKTMGDNYVAGFNEAMSKIQSAIAAEQYSVSAEYTAAAKSRDSARSSDSVSKLPESIVIKNYLSAELDVDGEKMAHKIIQSEELIDWRKGF
ncbi:MAG: phage tail tape measure protein [Oscillospiraceae bacterium]|nr:phage tail tape measure protein [Oscillospiraceae bacterium]